MRRKSTSQALRTFRLETLEERRLLHFSPIIAWEGATQTAEEWAQQVLSGFQDTQDLNSQDHDDVRALEKPVSEASVQQSLEQWSTDYWNELFGQTLDLEAWQQYSSAFHHGWPDIAPIWPRVSFNAEPTFAFVSATSSFDASERSNVQVPGVDEADAVEFSLDGHMFVARGSKLDIFDISNLDAVSQVSSIDLGDYQNRLYAQGDQLIVVQTSSIRAYDVSDKLQPKLVSEVDLSGWIQSSRMVDGNLVIISQDYFQVPPPEFLPEPEAALGRIALGEESLGRFETRDEYLERVGSMLISHFLPDATVSGGETSSTIELGDWQDLVLTSGAPDRHAISVLAFGIQDGELSIGDSETVLGIHADDVYASADTVYVVDELGFRGSEEESASIYQFDFDSDDIVAEAYGAVEGHVRNARMMDHYENDLRMVTEVTGPDGSASTNLYVLRPDGDMLTVVGELIDLADGQAIFGAHFNGERAILTTAEMEGVMPLFDPLHTIDLSDPSNPIEQSELEIPGVATHLQWINDSLIVGIGYFEGDNGNWHRQVSLFDVSDFAAPEVVTNWVSSYTVTPDFRGNRFDALSIQYDADSGVLLVPEREASFGVPWPIFFEPPMLPPVGFPWLGNPWWGVPTRPLELTVDPSVTPAPTTIPTITLPESRVTRMEPQRGALVFQIETETPELALLGTVAQNEMLIRAYIQDDHILAVGNQKVSVYSLDDLTPIATPEPPPTPEPPIGQPPATPPVNNPQFSDATADLIVVATNEDGSPVIQTEVGDRLWIEIQADAEGVLDDGFFQAIVDLDFDRQAFEVVSDPEPLSGFVENFVAEPDEGGFIALGGFSESLTPIGSGPNRIVRFLVEVKSSGSFEFTATPSERVGEEVLVYGDDYPLRPENVATGRLTIPVLDSADGQDDQALDTDVNNDGITSAIDVLMVINGLNARSNPASLVAGELSFNLDVNRDGILSALDALVIVNQLNAAAQNRVPALNSSAEMQAEGEPVEDEYFGDDTLQQLAAASASFWETERK